MTHSPEELIRIAEERVAAVAARLEGGELMAESVALTYATGKYGDDKRAFCADLRALLRLAGERDEAVKTVDLLKDPERHGRFVAMALKVQAAEARADRLQAELDTLKAVRS